MGIFIKELGIIFMYIVIALVAEKFGIWNQIILIMIIRVYFEIISRDWNE